jgi:hypothetical protein
MGASVFSNPGGNDFLEKALFRHQAVLPYFAPALARFKIQAGKNDHKEPC